MNVRWGDALSASIVIDDGEMVISAVGNPVLWEMFLAWHRAGNVVRPMRYTILTATWGNEDRTSAILTTAEVGALAASEVDTPDTWADFVAWQAAGNIVRALEDGGAYKEKQERDRVERERQAEIARFKLSATAKLAALGLTDDEIGAILS